MAARRKATRGSTAVPWRDFLARKTLERIPEAIVLTGDAPFLKDRVLDRILQELSAEGKPEILRLECPGADRLEADFPPSVVLDELRTPGLFARERLVIVQRADPFLSRNRDLLEQALEEGFSGARLVLLLEGKLDARTRFARKAAEVGWIIDCPQPYDRPPPWETRTPVWESDLSRYLVDRAREKGLELDLKTAFALHERAGTELGVLEEELEKLVTYLRSRGTKRVTEEVLEALTGDLREDSIFTTADAFLEGRRADAVASLDRLFRRGYRSASGTIVTDPVSIALPFEGAVLSRLKSLRRAHAVLESGGSREDLVREGLVQRPFLPRFERQLAANPPPRIRALLRKLFRIDRAVKSGADARYLLAAFVAE